MKIQCIIQFVKVMKKKNNFLIVGIFIIIIGIIIGIIPIFIKQNKTKAENKKIDDYIESTSIINTSQSELKSNTNIDTSNINKEEYLLVIEIPKINLRRGVYSLNSKLNSIKYNVQLMKESTMPNLNKSNLVLAAHNGNSKISFFDKLYKLKKDDEVYIYYNGVKYIYKLDKVYDVKKDGDVEVYRDYDKKTLTLITCKRNTKDMQSLFILYLDKSEDY